MNNGAQIQKFKNLSLYKIKENVREIRSQLPRSMRNIITYSKNFTLSLSNYCINNCNYCYYNYRVLKQGKEGNIILISEKQKKSSIQKALKYDCKEGLITSGEDPYNYQEVKNELSNRNHTDFIAFVMEICLDLLKFNLLPHTNIGLLSHDQLKLLKDLNASMGLMLESTSEKLFQKGGVHEFSPGKAPEKRINHIENAGKLKIPFTTGLLIGIGESLEDRIKDLFLIKEINDTFGHIQEVIIQNFVSKEGILYNIKEPIPVEEMLKIVGIAKIIFQNDISIQVPPNLIAGHEKDFIDVGINDFGGISPFTIDYINPHHKWPQIDHLSRICEKQGYLLKERLPIYDKFINDKEFCSETIKKTINNIT